MPRPLIGVTLDAEKPGGYSKFPWYALRQNYLDAIDAAGGLPVALPHEPDRVADYLERIDALVVTGGAFDVDPSYYGGGAKHATVLTKDRRTAFEFGVTQGALAQDKPVLGICGGQQLLHVVLGGKLIQHIPDSVADALAHGDGAGYVNFLGIEGEARVRAAYPGATWDRLVAVKRRYDPDNLFRLNQNIPPTG